MRGEAVIREGIPEGYKTKRNAVAGIINRDDTKGLKSVDIFFYELIQHINLPDTEEERLNLIQKMGFNVPPAILLPRKDLINTKKSKLIVDNLTDMIRRKARYPMDIDGIVLTKNTSKRENVMIPKNKIAFKITEDFVKTRVSGIVWNVTRTGRIVPVVHVDAVELGGVEVTHPTGHNYQWVKEKGIGEGAIIEIQRSGDVIPYIRAVFKKAKTFVSPRYCPSCNVRLIESDPDLLCKNQDCPGIAIAQIEYFITSLGAENIKYATIEKLYNSAKVRTLQDFFDLTERQISKIDGLGDITASMIIEERKKLLTTTEPELLAAFGIPLIGLKIAQKIFNHRKFKGSFDNFINCDQGVLRNIILSIEGIGPAKADAITDNISDYRSIYAYLKSVGLKFKKIKTTTKFGGKAFQFTGAMEKPREELETLVTLNGGRLASVSRYLDYLVIADRNSASSKATKARQLGIKMISEEEFLEMLGG
jgi:DNA ligase (NAD+)